MSRIISAILGQPEPAVTKTVGQLEDKNGYPSHDVRHLAQNIQKTRQKLSDLGLDPDDTTGEELYHALLVRFEQDSRQFDLQNGTDKLDFVSKAARAIQLVAQNIDMPQRWVLKSSITKQLLRQHPPKRLMKQLNYRSVESLLKRENIKEVYLAASFIESATWCKQFAGLVSKQNSAAFEPGDINICYLDQSKWGADTDKTVSYSDDVGLLALLESGHSQHMPLLSLTVLLIDALAGFKSVNLSKEVAHLSQSLSWWSDMDGLIANLNAEHVSLNIKDVSLNHDHSYGFADRVLDSSRQSFWHELLQRYDNQLAIEEDSLSDLKDQIFSFKAPLNQPAFEYEYSEDV